MSARKSTRKPSSKSAEELQGIKFHNCPHAVYRLESKTADNGLWYDGHGKFVFGIGRVKGCKTKSLPMGYDPRYHVDGLNWFSACSNAEDLKHWYSLEDALELIANGFVFTRYLVTDFIIYEHETVFLKETAISREELNIKDVFTS